jgi:hypothetical protein
MKSSWHNANSSLFKSWSLGVWGATIGKTIFTHVYFGGKKA